MIKGTPMYLLDVIPAVKLPMATMQLLTYFSKEALNIGMLVRVPVGRRTINALVVGVIAIHEQKIAIKKSAFQIKGISGIITAEPALNRNQITLLNYCAQYYLAPLSFFAHTFLPAYLIKKEKPISLDVVVRPVRPPPHATTKPLLVKMKAREELYAREIDICIAQGKQILFVVPEGALLRAWEQKLKRYCPLTLSSDLTAKKFFDAWCAIRSGTVRCIIGTRAAVFANFNDLGCIIVDEEQNTHYKSWDMAPYYHTVTVAKKLSELSGARLILGSNAPSITDYYRATEGIYDLVEETRPPIHVPHITVVDMRNELIDKNYTPFSYQTKQRLEIIDASESKKAILFVSRRGSESFSFCQDCSHIERCPTCNAHLTRHTLPKDVLICHQCGFIKEPQLTCSACHGTHIKTFGAGTQKIAQELKKLFPHMSALILDSDTAKTAREQRAIIESFNAGPAKVLIATQSMLHKPDIGPVDFVCIISLDNLLYFPDYTIGERIYQIVSGLTEYCRDTTSFILQTHTPEHDIILLAARQDYTALYSYEVQARKDLKYPPFSHIIKITAKDTLQPQARKCADTIAEKLRDAFEKTDYEGSVLGPAPAYIPKSRGQYWYDVVVKMGNIDLATRNAILQSFREKAIIDVDPESLI
ncbi:MAG: primosomal protein N' [Candidatus Azambacteria bacterium]|nr:primosomal protein N' [Candidatus Azambacteria bacterium]